ncbi:NAD-dependent epimerase/dehydratase family protein [Seohaeicola saemankumensis]|uniref:NAD-dependent epimerase/dehydratase family protein n=1 Tax=Seohaeicola saemankumensis TaxID=481181 RepID=A0ABW3T9M3_9RHOB
MSKGRALVTGRYGFTGHYVAEALATAGWDVWGACSHPTEDMGPLDRVADLTDAVSVSQLVDDVRPDAVVHLAGIAFVGHGSVDDFYHVNLLGTRNLLEALSRGGHGQRGVVLASSANVYGNARQTPITEDTPASPANDYGVSKLAMEYASRLFADDLPIVITRPFNYTGVGQDPKFLVPKIVSHFRSRAAHIELGNLEVQRDLSDVRDVARVYSALLESRDAHGKILNVCSGQTLSLKDIVDMCCKITGHEIELVVNPAFVRYDEVKILKGDAARLEAIIGPLKLRPFEQTLEWMLSG